MFNVYLFNVQVAELESLCGQGMVLCTYDGMIYHGQSAVCQKLVVDKDLVKSFGSLLQCKRSINYIVTSFSIRINSLQCYWY